MSASAFGRPGSRKCTVPRTVGCCAYFVGKRLPTGDYKLKISKPIAFLRRCRADHATPPAIAVRRKFVREESTLSQAAVRVSEIYKLQEMVALLADLRDAAHRLPEGTDRQNALREIRGYQIKMAGFVRRLGAMAA